MRIRTASVLGLVVAAMPAFVAAQEQTPECAQAQALAENGLRLATNGQYTAALLQFEESYRLCPRAGTLVNLGACERNMGHPERAIAHYRRALEELSDPGVRAATEAEIQSLEELLGTLRIEINVDAEVYLVDRRLGTVPGVLVIPVGDQVIEVRAEGHQTWRGEVRVESREETVLDLDLEPLDTGPPIVPPAIPPPPAPRQVSTPTWVTLGITGGALLAAVGFSIQALRLRNLINSYDPYAAPQIEAAQRDLDTIALSADVMWGITGALAIATVALYFAGRPEREADVESPSESGGHLSLRAMPSGLRLDW